MAKQKCPHCGKEVQRLDQHIRLAHPEIDDQGNGGQGIAGGQNLELDPAPSGDQLYHCVDCGETVQKGHCQRTTASRSTGEKTGQLEKAT